MITPLVILYDLLVIAFGLGVWMVARGRRALQVAAAMLIGIGAVGLPKPWLFPMNRRGVGGDVPHIIGTLRRVTSVQAKGMVTGEPTPWIGLAERICIGAFLAWVVVLAVALLRAERTTTADKGFELRAAALRESIPY